MKRIFLIALFIAIISGTSGYFFMIDRQNEANAAENQPIPTPVPKKAKNLPAPELVLGTEDYPFEIYVESQLQHRLDNYDEAVEYAKQFTNASVKYTKTGEVVWDNYLLFHVFYGRAQSYDEFETFAEAMSVAKTESRASVYFRRDNAIIWSNAEELPLSHRIERVPLISQLPELPRGCEVTSLAMLLRYKWKPVSKMELADKVKKDETPYQVLDGVKYAGNPHDGFVGDMRNRTNFGLGVYNGPIYELLRQYRPMSAVNLTGCTFDDLFYLIRTNRPVWIITNSKYTLLPDSAFERWVTPSGEISITYSEHSVLVTGYDESRIYFNDPLSDTPSSADRNNFIDAWEQMGSQAVTLSS